MTTALGRATGRWARVGDALYRTTTSGAVVLAATGRTAVTLSAAERSLWGALAEPASLPELAAVADEATVRAALERLTTLGVVQEVR